jgi:hypothetical protein
MIRDGDVRLIAQWQDDPGEALLTIDMRIHGGHCVSAWDLFGAFDLDGRKTRPFILRREGRIDFGSLNKDDWRTNLREADMQIGVCFTVWFNDADSGQYKIVKIATLGSRESE